MTQYFNQQGKILTFKELEFLHLSHYLLINNLLSENYNFIAQNYIQRIKITISDFYIVLLSAFQNIHDSPREAFSVQCSLKSFVFS